MKLESLRVQTLAGKWVTLESVREHRPGVIVLVRHYGCIFCRQRVADLVSQATKRPQLDLALFVVGNGTPAMAADFVQRYQIEIPVFTDPTRQIYQDLGMRRMFGLNWTSVKRGFAAYKAGHRQTAVQGDVWQQGGVAVFDAEGRITYTFADEEAGTPIPWTSVWHQFTQKVASI